MKEKKYFLVSLDHLPEGMEIFSCNLYIFNPLNNTYSIFLHANSPLTKNKREFLRLLESKSGSVAIDLSQKRTFLAAVNKTPKDIPGLTPYEKHPLEKAREIYLHQYIKKKEQREQTDTPFVNKVELKRCINENNFTAVIQEVRDEVITFPIDISQTVSLASFLAEQLLVGDNQTNRIVAFSFLLAKDMKIKDVSSLADIICSAFLYHLGQTQLNRSLIKVPFLQLSERNQSLYRRHPGLTQHLLKKIDLEVSSDVVNTILEHHERIDGHGYPHMKKESAISITSQIIGAVSHLFEISTGRITTDTIPLLSAISQIISGTNSPGLEKIFPPSIIEVLESIHKVSKEQLILEGEDNGIKG